MCEYEATLFSIHHLNPCKVTTEFSQMCCHGDVLLLYFLSILSFAQERQAHFSPNFTGIKVSLLQFSAEHNHLKPVSVGKVLASTRLGSLTWLTTQKLGSGICCQEVMQVCCVWPNLVASLGTGVRTTLASWCHCWSMMWTQYAIGWPLMKVLVTCTVNNMETRSLIVPLPSYSRHDKQRFRLGEYRIQCIMKLNRLIAILFQ